MANSTETNQIEDLDPKQYIIIKGAKVNNLKNLSVAIPRHKLVVITGLSGSGKSSLAFDTLFAEGQRMYVESLSSYARQFLGRMDKPEVEYIKGVSPAIAIEQKVNTRNPRSTVGTTTEIYDYLKLLFARIGKTYSPISGKEVFKDTVTSVVRFIQDKEEGEKLMILAPLHRKPKRSITDELNVLLSKGYTRIMINDELSFIEEVLESRVVKKTDTLEILIDRAVVKKEDEDNQFRISDSVQTAFFEGEGECIVHFPKEDKVTFSDRFELDGIVFEEPTVNLFSFNNPYGACKTCEGFGRVLGIDPDKVIPDKRKSVFEGAVACWRGESMKKWQEDFIYASESKEFPIHRPYYELSEDQKELLWHGAKGIKGIDQFFKFIESKTHKIQYRVMLSRYRGRTTCPDCKGTRLRKDASYVKIDEKSITDLVLMPIEKTLEFIRKLELNEYQNKVSKRLVKEIENRLDYLSRVGLGYLTLNRLTNTLSGGEYQRIKLATSLGSALVGSMYILDEPSIGLHPRDTERLISVLTSLRDLGNSVIVVEHEEEVMRAADQIIDIGPDAGSHGGELIFQGTLKELNGNKSYTAKYLKGEERIEVPEKRRKAKGHFEVIGASENNLKNIDVKIPLGILTAITGVSGSGKSTLVKKIIHPAISKLLEKGNEETGQFVRLEGETQKITGIEFVDQNPIGKSSRSNPVTYIKAYDGIRQLYANQQLSKQNGFKPAHFSFNVDGGRCETCQGEGTVRVEMQFMADIFLKCETCKGKRFKNEVLEVQFQGKNIAEILDMTVEDSIDFFKDESTIVNKLMPLQDVGLGYITLGQSSNSLSGGEAQRVKLAYYLSKGSELSKEHTLFIFDEPTTGLHFHDIKKLMASINALIQQGNTAIIIEHNVEVIKLADHIIDLGPEGGEKGGSLVFEGSPEEMIAQTKGYTFKYLKEKLKA